MQTFLPYADFTRSAAVLDRARLGKQRVEVLQILRVLHGLTHGWQHHPAVLMWQSSPGHLVDYGVAICDEWIRRGYRDTCRDKIKALYVKKRKPPVILGHELFHSSHRAALLHKFPSHYGQFGWVEVPRLDYVWTI